MGCTIMHAWHCWSHRAVTREDRKPMQKEYGEYRVSEISSSIGTYRAVWLPGQDLAMLHLMESLFCHYTVHHKHTCNIGCLRIRSSCYEYTWFEITQAMPGYARACRWLWAHQSLYQCDTFSCFHGARIVLSFFFHVYWAIIPSYAAEDFNTAEICIYQCA